MLGDCTLYLLLFNVLKLRCLETARLGLEPLIPSATLSCFIIFSTAVVIGDVKVFTKLALPKSFLKGLLLVVNLRLD